MADGRTIVFFPEGAYGPTNNCVGIGDVLRRARPSGRVHRRGVVRRHARGEGLRGAADAARAAAGRARGPGPVLDRLHPRHGAGVPQVDARADRGVHAADVAGPDRRLEVRRPAAARDHRRARAGRDRRGQRRVVPRGRRQRAAVGPDRVLQPGRDQGPGDRRRSRRATRPPTRAGWATFRAEYDRTHARHVAPTSTRSAAITARPASRTRRWAPSSCTSRRT